ncbi:uncharacterized protein LOC129582499 isoform X2 [Paramacrobiotus metropolitanus]|uniref:uncharacterized protein LOC129582499 isoform X2 n=1 Tax=Paramacrobiotus metropolitanus TaxID=2943436 RepID=UPI002446118B|nr:uncharacterized protein LOC129582499 isoform X2 [Paramacrobiotus metropolitanus]
MIVKLDMSPMYCIDTTVHCTFILVHFRCLIQQVVYILLHYGGALQRIWLVKAFQRTSDGLLRACLCVRADQLEKVRQGRCKFFSTGAKATFLLTITPLIAEFMNFLYPNFRGATSNEGSSGKSWPEPLKEFFHLVNDDRGNRRCIRCGAVFPTDTDCSEESTHADISMPRISSA